MRELEIYIHIPFCVKKCGYCDFLSAPASEIERKRYVQNLIREIKSGLPVSAYSLLDPSDAVVTSVFIGGGTPSILKPEEIAGILEALRGRFHFAEGKDAVESTIECNPGTITKEKLSAYRACGINRLSIGLQSADDAELKTLGRIHTWEDFRTSYEMAREAGFQNINIDLMSGLPDQSVFSLEKTLQKVLQLKPEHLSVYSLIIEEGTPFYELYHEDDLIREKGEEPKDLPSEEEERGMADLTKEMLVEKGLYRYEISNYALPGYECRHNIGYWQRKEYLGFGLGASSLLRVPDEKNSGTAAVRLKNPSDLLAYDRTLEKQSAGLHKSAPLALSNENPVEGAEREVLSTKDEMEEFMFLGLRMTKGISEKKFADLFGCPIDEIYKETIDRLIPLGLLVRKEGRIYLSAKGLDLANPVMAEFLL